MTASTPAKTKFFAIALLSFNTRLNETYLEAASSQSTEETRAIGNAWDERYPAADGWTTVMDVKEVSNNGN